MEPLRQPVATGGNGFRLFPRFSGGRFAADCHRLQPRGSIKAPSSVAGSGYVGGPLSIGGAAAYSLVADVVTQVALFPSSSASSIARWVPLDLLHGRVRKSRFSVWRWGAHSRWLAAAKRREARRASRIASSEPLGASRREAVLPPDLEHLYAGVGLGRSAARSGRRTGRGKDRQHIRVPTALCGRQEELASRAARLERVCRATAVI
jgi:hypothetical protein